MDYGDYPTGSQIMNVDPNDFTVPDPTDAEDAYWGGRGNARGGAPTKAHNATDARDRGNTKNAPVLHPKASIKDMIDTYDR